ncbi:Cna B-type domain-containing protein [Myroides sp. JBRI-B21084]|uniref:DUF7507 domain-containing protein n=1 Tax=Myroides sp. JBRI-B21084 TaxID=3119977 RepID=UPI0026E3AAC9|nr:Cna B-type domain-containing protein [Paenimyroides cloacae]WKW46581.1 Cna B-type domain-containing protein [Paenimyroides cloacae]
MKLKLHINKLLFQHKTLLYLIGLFLIISTNTNAQNQCTFTLDSNSVLVSATVTGTSTNNKLVPKYVFVGMTTGSTVPKLYVAAEMDNQGNKHATDITIGNANTITSTSKVCDNGSSTFTIGSTTYTASNTFHWEIFEFDLTGVNIPNGTVNYSVTAGAGGFDVSGTMILNVQAPPVDVTVTKNWIDNSATTRPTLQMQVIGTPSGGISRVLKTETVTGTGNTWTYTFTQIPKYDVIGRLNVFTADEVDLTGYCKQLNGLTVTNYIVPTISISSSYVCYGQNVTLTATSDKGNDPFGGTTYQWQRSSDGVIWTNISGATSITYTINNLQSTDLNYTYRVQFIPQGQTVCIANAPAFQLQIDAACTAAVSITKEGTFNDLNNDNIAQPNETISYTITVKNNGTIALTNIVVNDPLLGGNLSVIPTGDTNLNNILDLTETWTYTVVYSVTSNDIFVNKGVYNRASVTATAPPGNVSALSTDPTPYTISTPGYDVNRPNHTYVSLKGQSVVISNPMIYQKAK